METEKKCDHAIEIHTYNGWPMEITHESGYDREEQVFILKHCPYCGSS